MVNPAPAEMFPHASELNDAASACSSALWSALVVAMNHASQALPETTPACPVTSTWAALPPGAAPKSIVAVPVAPMAYSDRFPMDVIVYVPFAP